MPLIESEVQGDVLQLEIEQPGEDVVAAAFRRENIVGGILGAGPAPGIPLEGYDPLSDIEGYERYALHFIDDVSPEEVAWRKRKIDQQHKDRATLDAAGWKGVTASVAAGMTDPITLPFLFARGIAAGRPLLSASRLAGQGFAGTVATEVALQSMQESRTALESTFAITAGTLLSGVLGGALGSLTRQEIKQLEKAVEADFTVGSVGASAVSTESTELAGGASNKLAMASPLGLVMNSSTPKAKELGMSLAENAWFLRGNVEGDASPQAIETIVKRYEGARGQAVVRTNELYQKYRTGVEQDSAIRRGIASLSTDGKLNFKQFREEVGRAMRRNDEHAIPEVQEAARFYRQKIFDPIKQQLDELELLDEGELVGAPTYLSRVYDVEKLRAKPQPFKDELAKYFQEQDGELELAEALEIAEGTVAKILGTSEGPVPIHVVGKPSATKGRVLTIPDERIEDYLISDVDWVSSSHVRTLAPHIELTRRYGDASMADDIDVVRDQYKNLIQKNPDQAKALKKEEEQVVARIEAMRDRLLGTYGMPADPTSGFVRAGRVFREMNYLSLLGGMTISALPDIARPLMVNGFRAYGRALSNLATAPREFGVARSELKAMGAGLDMINSTRSRAIAGTEPYYATTRFERGLQSLGNQFGRVSLMAPWNAFWKQFSGVMSTDFILTSAGKYADGSISPSSVRRMAAMGIDRPLALQINEQFQKHGDAGDVKLTNVDLWDDREAAEAFENAVLRQVDTAIITPGIGDMPLFTSTEAGKLLVQFKSFAMAAQNRMLVSALQDNELQAYSGLLLAMGVGSLTYGIKTTLAGREIDSRPANVIAEAMDRSGMMGYLSEVSGIAEKASGGLVGLKPMLGAMTGEELQPMSRFVSRNAVGALLGPSFGTATRYLQSSGGWCRRTNR